MSRLIDVKLCLEVVHAEKFCIEEASSESLQGQSDCFQNDGQRRKGGGRNYAMGIEEGIERLKLRN